MLADTLPANDEDLTVVIITFNRYACLSRLLRFYEGLNIKFKILVLDSSDIEIDNLNDILGSILDITYKRFDSSIFFVNKISESLALINTRYAVLAADDDFLMPSGLRESLKFLHSNQDYSSAHGRYFLHSVKSALNATGSISINPLYLTKAPVECSDPLDRVASYLSGRSSYFPFFAVHRTEDFKRIWRSTGEHVSDWGLSELYPCALSLIFGRSKVLDVFYASREPNYDRWYDEKRYFAMYSDAKLERAVSGLHKEIRAYGFSDDRNINLSRLFQHYVFKCAKSKEGMPLPKKNLPKRICERCIRVLRGVKTMLSMDNGFRASLYRGGVAKMFINMAFLELREIERAISKSEVGRELKDSRARYASHAG